MKRKEVMKMFTRNEMLEKLHASECEVTFRKVNGDLRIMNCTLKRDVLTNAGVFDSDDWVSKRKVNESVVNVWDLDKKAWRSFKVDSVETFEVK